MSKKQNEHRILNLIYDENEYAEIIESEQPDFHIKHRGADSYFGVEITEFYYSESNARLQKIPNYFNEIMNLDHYRHKHDKKNLKVEEFTVNSAQGEFKRISRGIIQKLPQPSEYADMIANLIEIKSNKFDEYNHTLTHTNLIISDVEKRLEFAPIGDFYKYFFTEEIKKALYSTQFREIFLVTVLEKNRYIYVPLKLLLLFADFHMFGTLALEYPWETSDTSEDQLPNNDSVFMIMFANYMRSKTNKIYFREELGQGEVIFGNSGMRFGTDGKIICDYNDYLYPSGLQIVKNSEFTTFFRSPEFCEQANRILSGTTFYTEVAREVRSTFGF